MRKFAIAILGTYLFGYTTYSQPGGAEEPIRYVGEPKIVDQQYHDGQLRPAVGVHSYQVLRAAKTNPPESDNSGNAYNHAPMLAFWNNQYYLEYLGSEWGEHGIPTQTYLTHSEDGMSWENPQLIFPAIEYEPGKFTIAHQRMGFYVSPEGRLLVLAFYGIPTGYADSPNKGNGIGRAVREVYSDNSLGPIYFIRCMPHAGYPREKASEFYPFFTASEDQGFIQACESLLNDKLMTQQWWEEDQSEDGFYALDDSQEGFEPKAFSFFHRQDGKVVGLWKSGWAAISDDEGKSWNEPVLIKTTPTSSAKTWGQRTESDSYAIVYNPMPKTFYRYPLAVITSEDGTTFDDMLAVHTEVPPKRYNGNHKEYGPQYVRGIAEGNGNPPGTTMPVVYSINKEDIWISHIPTPIVSEENNEVLNDFEAPDALAQWNLYSPKWARVERALTEEQNWVLKLADQDPLDYAQAVRVFPQAQQAKIELRLNLNKMETDRLEIEVLDQRGNRALRLQFASDYRLFWASNGANLERLPQYDRGKWYDIQMDIDTENKTYDLLIDGKKLLSEANLYQEVDAVERIAFRTGVYRRERQYDYSHKPENSKIYVNADQKVEGDEIWIDELKIVKK